MFLSIIAWVKALAILGLLYQVVILAFSVHNYHLYLKYQTHYAQYVRNYLAAAIAEVAQAVAGILINILCYYLAVKLKKAVSQLYTEKLLLSAFLLNLWILKLEVAFIAISIIHNSYLLWRLNAL